MKTQIQEEVEERAPLEAENCYALISAVLWQAISDACRKPPKTRQAVRAHYEARQSARLWFKKNDVQPFGFRWCCDILDIQDPERLRQRVLNEPAAMWREIQSLKKGVRGHGR